MNEKKIIKFNLYMSCALLLAFIAMFIGVTIAYFSDRKQLSATLTAGNVEITLSQAAVKPDLVGNLVEDTSKTRIFGAAEDSVVNNYGKIYPGQSIYKDPTITNIGDEDEWVAAKVTIVDGEGDLTKVIGYSGYEEIDIERLLSGGLLDEHVDFGIWNGIEDVCYNDNYAMIQVANAAAGEFSFYFIMEKPLAVGDSVMLFDHLAFDERWNNEHMEHLKDLKIYVQAFGVQTMQLDSCLEAMTTAFPYHFDFN